MYGRGLSSIDHDFNAYDATGKIWHTGSSTFVTEAVADYLSYRIAATKNSDANDADIDAPFSATAPTGTVRYIMRERGASLPLSYTVWEGNEKLEADAATAATQATAAALDASKIPRLTDAIAAGAAVRRNKVAATSTTLDETLEATP